jgi:uncharacterized protein (DUF2147 family)
MSALLLALAAAMAPVGSWVTEDGSAVVRIEQCGASLCGTVAKVLNSGPGIPTTDVHNPKSALRARSLQGLAILGGFTQSGNQWTGGTIYDPKTGKTYHSKIAMNPDGTLSVSGCILFICETQRWTAQR